MGRCSRREFIEDIAVLAIASLVFPLKLGANPEYSEPHPLSPPDPVFQGRCPNCGMVRSMWARTWKTFALENGHSEACSFHCLVDQAEKSGHTPRDIQTALFLQPRGMVRARAAWYVIGSSAKGTMTKISKAAFARRSAALDFARVCGGDTVDFEAVYQSALKTLGKEIAMIDRKRLAKGKIVPPVDKTDECVMCRMYPSRYPRHRSQVALGKGKVGHFCSTHCLFAWLGDQQANPTPSKWSGMIWVTDYVSGRWISGRTAYYVLDSRTIGPMGAEAIAFDRRSDALAFSHKTGGRVLTFDQVTTGLSAWPV